MHMLLTVYITDMLRVGYNDVLMKIANCDVKIHIASYIQLFRPTPIASS